MPTSDPEARKRTSANSNDAITSVKLFISRSRNCPTNFSLSILSKRVSLQDGDKLKLVGHSQTHHRSFKVVRLSKANRIARIKKRKTIFDSFHPTISKW